MERILLKTTILGWAVFLLGVRMPLADEYRPFSVGEKIRYSIHASGLKIGYQTIEIASLEEANGIRFYALMGRSTASSVVSAFYRLDDRWSVFMDERTLYPFKVEKVWAEGKKEGFYTYEIDQEQNLVRMVDQRNQREKILHPKNRVFDLFTLLYYYRAQGQSIDNPFTFDFLESKSVKTVHFQDEGVLEIAISKVSAGKPVSVRKLKQIGGAGIELYVSTDPLRLPLKLVTPAKISKKVTVDVEFIIDGFFPGENQKEIPKAYRRLKY